MQNLYFRSGWKRPSESEIVRNNAQCFGIQVGVSINLFIKRSSAKTDLKSADIFYTRVDEFWRKEEKYHYLDSKQHYQTLTGSK